MIDFHTHPLLVEEIVAGDPDLMRGTQEVFYIRNRLQPLETFLLEMDVSGLERAVIAPIDATHAKHSVMFTNEHIARLCGMSDRFIGFASVDPHDRGAAAKLEGDVRRFGLRGLKLSPSLQEFAANDRDLAYPVYEAAASLGIPLLIHTGMTWAPRCLSTNPMDLERVAFDFPKLNIVLAHFGWPWVHETAMLLLKYDNLFADTSCLTFDAPWEFMRHVFTERLPLTLLERSLRTKVVFGSDYPRVEIKNMVRAVSELGLSDGALEMIFSKNARYLLGEAEASYK
ncbi:MAG: amidohydrolase family protein [Anaerolineae bacterium]